MDGIHMTKDIICVIKVVCVCVFQGSARDFLLLVLCGCLTFRWGCSEI